MAAENKKNTSKAKPSWLTQDYVREKNHLLFEVKVGSQAYGTATPESDVDIKGVFLMPDEAANSIFFDDSWETLTWNNGLKGKDKVESEWVSLRKFLRELLKCNPGRLEMAFSPDDCIMFLHDGFKCILDARHVFLTKQCEKAFAQYAVDQIHKARGQNKKQNWSAERKTRQPLIDFCYVPSEQGSITLKEALGRLAGGTGRGREDEMARMCGLVKTPHMRDVYAVFYDPSGKLGYKGILSKDGNNVTKSKVERAAVPQFFMQFNTDAWAIHCKDYREWEEWEVERNDDRWVDVQGHGQKIDGKNMLHCVRLIDVSTEIAIDKTIHVRRTTSDIERLLDIKKGRVKLEEIIEQSEAKLKNLPEIYEKSGLPDIVDPEIADLLYWKSRSYVIK